MSAGVRGGFCPGCGSAAGRAVAFCAGCGTRLDGGGDRLTRYGSKGYTGPRRLLIFALLLLFPGMAAAYGCFSVVSAKAVASWGVAFDLVRGPVNTGLQAAGVAPIAQTANGGDSSFLLIIAFVVGSTVAAFGACLLMVALLWMFARWSPRRRAVAAIRGGRAVAGRAVEGGREAVDRRRLGGVPADEMPDPLRPIAALAPPSAGEVSLGATSMQTTRGETLHVQAPDVP